MSGSRRLASALVVWLTFHLPGGATWIIRQEAVVSVVQDKRTFYVCTGVAQCYPVEWSGDLDGLLAYVDSGATTEDSPDGKAPAAEPEQ